MSKVKRCGICRNFRAFTEPYIRKDAVTIYGFCFKGAKNSNSPDMGEGYPVFLPPESEAACTGFVKRGVDKASHEIVRADEGNAAQDYEWIGSIEEDEE